MQRSPLKIFQTDGMELIIIMVATFGQALCAPSIPINIIGVLIFWRFVVSRMCSS